MGSENKPVAAATVQHAVEKAGTVKLIVAPRDEDLKGYEKDKLLDLVKQLFAERAQVMAVTIAQEPPEEEPSQFEKVRKSVVETVVKNKRKIVTKLKKSAKSFSKSQGGSSSDGEIVLNLPAPVLPADGPDAVLPAEIAAAELPTEIATEAPEAGLPSKPAVAA